LAVAFMANAAGCSPDANQVDTAIPVIQDLASRPFEYSTIEQLATNASAIVVATPTGVTREEPLPAAQGGTAEAAPTLYVTVTVDQVLAGALAATTIEVVSPGVDQLTGEPALAEGQQFLLFIAPAMYAAYEPAGGYAIVGGPAGMFASSGATFAKVDTESPSLPETLNPATTAWPAITRTEAELVQEGPR